MPAPQKGPEMHPLQSLGSVCKCSGTDSSLTFSDTCGQPTSTNEGAEQPLLVQLTVRDNQGNTATASSGTPGQPALKVRLFTCGI